MATEVKRVEEYDLKPERLNTVSYGESHPVESRPVEDNSAAEGRGKKRRVIGKVTCEEGVD